MAKVEGKESLLRKLALLDRKARESNLEGTVGYSAAYATHVHEDLEAHHTVGQAKFLEQPARELQHELSQIISAALQQGKSMRTAILLACLRLQRESQLLVPVDTGALRASAFSEVKQR